MTYLIPNRLQAAQLRYQLKRFEKQCKDAGLPKDTLDLIEARMLPLRRLINDQAYEPGDGCVPDYKWREAASLLFAEKGRIEIDDLAMVSPGDDPGCYVQAWVWVPAEAIEN